MTKVSRTSHIDGTWVPGVWAIVVPGEDAGGLRELTVTPNGVNIPKQYCSLRGGPSLLTQAIVRANVVAPAVHTCAVVAAHQRCWWAPPLAVLPKENILIEPEPKGTANAVLLGLLELEARDPDATVVILPAGHHLREERLFGRTLWQMAHTAVQSPDLVYLLGTEPDRVDTELTYVIPADRKRTRAARVLGVIERPDTARVRSLLRIGALWDMCVIAGSMRALLALYDRSHGASVALMRGIVRGKHRGRPEVAAAASNYRRLPSAGFVQELLEPQSTQLQVLRVPTCGWSDLGSPARVREALLHLDVPTQRFESRLPHTGILSLAHQLARLERAGGRHTSREAEPNAIA